MYFVFIFLNFKYSSLRERKKNAACLGLKVLALHVFHFLGVKKKTRRERSEIVEEFKKAYGRRGQGKDSRKTERSKNRKGRKVTRGQRWTALPRSPALDFLLTPAATCVRVQSTDEPAHRLLAGAFQIIKCKPVTFDP